MNNIQFNKREESLNSFSFKRIYTLRGLLYSGKYDYWSLREFGFSNEEIKTAVSLNKKYFLNKCSGGLKV